MVVGPDALMSMPWLEAPLRQALAQQRAHALLVSAPEGIGALEFMLGLAQAWLCEAAPEARPCGRCESCRLLHAQAHPDLKLLMPEALRVERGWAGAAEEGEDGAKAKRKPSRQIRIDEIRSAIDWIGRSSSRAQAKVVLLFPAEAMNMQSANALLKTLEEPPGSARLLLGTADPAQLLATVRSRCQTITLHQPTTQQALAWLSERGIADARALLAAAGGRPLRAAEMAAAGIGTKAWQALPQAVADGRSQAFAGWSVASVLDALCKLCHDAMRMAAGGQPVFFEPQAIPKGAGLVSLNELARSLARVAAQREHPWNEGLLIDALLSEARRCWQDATSGVAARA